jgi:hypothetical protein
MGKISLAKVSVAKVSVALALVLAMPGICAGLLKTGGKNSATLCISPIRFF